MVIPIYKVLPYFVINSRKYFVRSSGLSTDLDCSSKNAIYLISCTKCGVQYVGKTGHDAFYLQPSHSMTTSCWYSRKPLGHNTLSKTVTRICKAAGIEGYKTNHSLRATSTSRLYHSGVDEQMVMEMTGHRSIDVVRSYKRTSEGQREALSDVLSDVLNRKAPRIGDTSNTVPSSGQSITPTAPVHKHY